MSDRQTVAPTTVPVPLSDMKLHLNVSSTNDDAFIDAISAAATEYIERRASIRLIQETRELKMQTFEDPRYVHDRIVYLPTAPVSSISSIAYITTTGGSTTVGSTVFRTSTGDRPARLAEEYNERWPDTRNVLDDVTITYIAGFSSANTGVPERLKAAVKLLTGHWYRNREAVVTGTVTRELELGLDALMGMDAIEHYG